MRRAERKNTAGRHGGHRRRRADRAGGAADGPVLERLWSHNIAITTRLVDTQAIPQLMSALRSGRLDAGQLVTHRFRLDQIEQAYATFGNAAQTEALKVIISAD